MNTTIYQQLSARLRARVADIAHIDLYNQQYNDPARATVFNTPAVFIEYLEAKWGDDLNGAQEAISGIRFHIVMSNHNDTTNIDLLAPMAQQARLACYQVTKKVHEAVNGYAPDNCTPFCRALSAYDQNHDQILVEKTDYFFSELDETASRYINYATATPELEIEREIVVPGS